MEINEPSSPSALGQGFPWKGIWSVLWRRRWLIIGLTATLDLGFLLFLWKATLIYEATAAVQIVRQSDPTDALPREEGLYDKLSFIETHKSMIVGREVFSLLIDRLPGLQPEVPISREKLLLRVRQAVNVNEIRFTDLLEIKVRYPKKKMVAEIANGLVNVYRDWLAAGAEKSQAAMTQFIDQQAAVAKARLEEVEADILNYNRQNALISISEQIRQELEAMQSLENRLVDMEARQAYTQDLIRKIGAQPQDITLYAELTDKESVRELARSYDQLDLTLKSAVAFYQPQHPKMLELQAKCEALRNKLHSRLLEFYRSQQLELGLSLVRERQALNAHRSELDRLRSCQCAVEPYLREMKTREEAYLKLLAKLEESRILQAKHSLVEVKIVAAAVEPERHVWPKRVRTLAIGMLISLLLSAGFAYGYNRYRGACA
jgi:uncharacterized protein involved in exopolysaccharide biosynthesis